MECKKIRSGPYLSDYCGGLPTARARPAAQRRVLALELRSLMLPVSGASGARGDVGRANWPAWQGLGDRRPVGPRDWVTVCKSSSLSDS
jgi:hypothetical protein